MKTLTVNAGSSSLRFSVFDKALKPLYKGHIDGIGGKNCKFRRNFDGGEIQKPIQIKTHAEAIHFALIQLQKDEIISNWTEIKKVAHRVVHGGEKYKKPTLLNASSLRMIRGVSSLAPLHNPANLEGISGARKYLPKAKHYAIFDTAFHTSLPEKAYLYGLPYRLYKVFGIRRYGFHGTSHHYVYNQACKELKRSSAKVITCHIGNGVSVAAIKHGECLDTSMGFTPLEGPLMGTRSGSFDPAIIFHLERKGLNKDRISHMVQKESGFLGLSEMSSDIRDLWAKPKSKGTKRTFDVFSYQMAKIIASYTVALGSKPDAIVFTAGIGENAFYLRQQICDQLAAFNIKLLPSANESNQRVISSTKSAVKVFVIPTDEAKQMASEIA